MNTIAPTMEIATDLQDSLGLHQEILGLVERENRVLRQENSPLDPSMREQKQRLLLRLGVSLAKLRRHRLSWQGLGPAERRQRAEVPALLRENQEMIMKIIVLDRENEQTLLRRGLVPPACLPSANRNRPGYVAGVYKRHDSA